MRFAEVAVDAPAGYSRTFSYSVPPALGVRPGHQVRVPFGSRTLQGVVFSLPDTPQVPETRDIIATTTPDPILTPHQLELARWVADYYMSTLFEAAALMLPPGSRVRPKTYLSLGANRIDGESSDLSPGQIEVVEYIQRRGKVDQERIFEALGRRIRRSLDQLVDGGFVLRSMSQGRPSVGHKYRLYVGLTRDAARPTDDQLSQLGRRAPRQAALIARLLEEDESLSLAEARKSYGESAADALVSKGLAEKYAMAVERDPLAGAEFPRVPLATLTPAQAQAVSAIRNAIEHTSASPRTFLLQGVTGSGKTEVYLDAVEHCVRVGKRAIVLVPEIALTHQTVERFAVRFPRRVAVLHSGLSHGEQFDQWWKIRGGEYDVVVGSRGAVFAPQSDLGLVVLDEEHEWTYKQVEPSPRYHARDAAIRLARLTGAVTVLGSASPDVTSYYKAKRGEYGLLELPDRFVAEDVPSSRPPRTRGLPSVKVVDMRQELREGNRSIFSRALTSAMSDSLETGAQVVLFLNRRGSASYLQCRSCGRSLRCHRCDVALTYHKGADRLLCHYCGYRRRKPKSCPNCQSTRLSYYGVGTETVVDEVRQSFPEARVLRWDRDATKRPGDYEQLLNSFRGGEAQVLVGTQMIAKGLHFPSVALVGVVSADVGLNVPDYRAGERTFQLLCQVAGRAGRGDFEGRVVVQTYQPDNYAVRAGAVQYYLPFYRHEMELRREQGNPPYSKLVRLMYAHTNRAFCQRQALDLSNLLRQERDAWGYTDAEVLGPTPGYPPRVRGRYRWQLVLRAPEPRILLDKVTVPQGWVVDIDPIGFA